MKDSSSAMVHSMRRSFFNFCLTEKAQLDLYGHSNRINCDCSEPKESPSNNPGLHTTPDQATKAYFTQQTMFRIKDPKVSLDFYSRVLGTYLLKRLDFLEMKFSLYFMGYEDTTKAPSNPVERTVWTFSQKATMELTDNWGTENDPEFKGYHNGNSEPLGYGHIGIAVDDTYKACERFQNLGVEFVTKPDDGFFSQHYCFKHYFQVFFILELFSAGEIKGLAFIKDPDGYWIELFDLKILGGEQAAAHA
ncbi:hypothetical protein JHK82_031299 [Glycine max]|uniref:Lactoylglutathione lyase n=2 Tax=Glycine subgen. Soja TaxID=1462606 RepID=A0A0R0HJE4_SOYBN|nr:hypothetical protein JHK85_031952 [Glycine max]KAG4994563.1 hypothetical protein JHK86_031390 [Glycine max]KAG5124562.1 hypothetical protein JHK82_031299 [Glycine max]KAG5145987.1 hypothetical protein JHK84_031530 [Glycine max]RZB80420.1 Lactoylglutathione lyase [Glycine soja]